MKPSEVLAAARAKIATPEKWNSGGYARDKAGELVWYDKPSAVAWCVMGAIRSTCAEEDQDVANDARGLLIRAIGSDPVGVAVWNDAADRKHHEVLAALSRAYALAIKDGQ